MSRAITIIVLSVEFTTLAGSVQFCAECVNTEYDMQMQCRRIVVNAIISVSGDFRLSVVALPVMIYSN